MQAEIPSAADPGRQAEALVVGPADLGEGPGGARPARPVGSRMVHADSAQGESVIAHPGLHRPGLGAGAQLQLVVVHRPDSQVGVILADHEPGRGAESGPGSPKGLLVGLQSQGRIAHGVVGFLPPSFIEVVQHHGVGVRAKWLAQRRRQLIGNRSGEGPGPQQRRRTDPARRGLESPQKRPTPFKMHDGHSKSRANRCQQPPVRDRRGSYTLNRKSPGIPR